MKFDVEKLYRTTDKSDLSLFWVCINLLTTVFSPYDVQSMLPFSALAIKFASKKLIVFYKPYFHFLQGDIQCYIKYCSQMFYATLALVSSNHSAVLSYIRYPASMLLSFSGNFFFRKIHKSYSLVSIDYRTG